MDDSRPLSRSAFAARSASLVLAAVTGALLALVAAWFFTPRFLEGFEAEVGEVAWAAIGLAGGAVGLAIAAAFGAAPRPLPAIELGGRPDPAHGSWLHVVSGGDHPRIARATFEVVAHAIARRRRIVLVDASRGLRLHARLGLSARLGLVECMSQGAPALGLLQSSGFTGLFLLARGRTGRLTDWLPLDRVLEELRPHFEQVVLVFERDIPPVVGGVLAGRVVSGWWAGPGSAKGRHASRASASLAIPLFDIDLAGIPEATLEALEARLGALLPGPAPGSTETPFLSPEPPPIRVSPPAVLDCDLQIRQKLRFLAWMRRMRTERERAETAGRP